MAKRRVVHSARFVQDALNLRLASVHFPWVGLAKEPQHQHQKPVLLSCIFITYLYSDRITSGENKQYRFFCAIDIRLGCQASRCANISQNQRATKCWKRKPSTDNSIRSKCIPRAILLHILRLGYMSRILPCQAMHSALSYQLESLACASSSGWPFRKSVSLTFIPFFSVTAFASRKDSHHLEVAFKAVLYQGSHNKAIVSLAITIALAYISK